MLGESHEQEIIQNPTAQTTPKVPKPSFLENFLNRIRGIENVSSSAVSQHALNQPPNPAPKEPLPQSK